MTDKKLNKISAPKGVPDYVPPNSAQFIAVRDTFAHHIRLAGYEHIELPIFEDTTLFARGVGESTDVVSKEMYTFADRGGRSVTLRPEGTAGVMRAVIEHNLDRGQLPVKLGYYGPFFRYERPQAGRYRQLQQVGVEAIGVDDPTLDAEVIALADRCFSSIGLKDYRLELTSLGDATCRPAYREKLQEFLLKLPLDDATRHRAEIKSITGVYKREAATMSNKVEKVQALIDAFEEAEGRRPRILVAKIGQDGHDRGQKVIASAFADVGFDVDIGPLFATADEAARQAVENDVHILGVSSLAAAHLTAVPELKAALKKHGREDIMIIIGGVVPPQDYDALYAAGAEAIFPPGTVISEAAEELIHKLNTRLGHSEAAE